MLFENPFFTREVRASARKAWSPLGWSLLAAAGGPLLGLWLTSRAPDWSDPMARGTLLAMVAGCHALLCSLLGWRLGTRVLGAEQWQNTLESLRLVSGSPWQWVLQKLVFPVYVLVLIWLAALPGCLMLALRAHFLPGTLWPGLLLAGAAGLLAFGAALVIPPERAGLPLASERKLPLAQRLELSSPRLVSLWISWEILQLTYQWLDNGSRDQQPVFRQHALFHLVSVGSDRLLAGMLAMFLLYGLTCAWAWANPASPAATGLRRAVLLFTLTTGYLLVLGVTWFDSNWFWQCLVVGLPAVQLLRLALAQRKTVLSRRTARRDSLRATREIAAVQARWDNPVLVRDLRVSLRGGGLLPIFLRQWLALGSVGGIIATLFLSRNTTLTDLAGPLAAVFGWGAFVSVMRMGAGASAQWDSERRMKTISQLLLSPITGYDIVLGRWIAAVLAGVAVSAPWILSFLFCMFVASQGEDLTSTICFGVWTVSLALVLSAGRAGASRKLSGWREWRSPAGAAIVWFFAQPFLLIKIGTSAGSGGMVIYAMCIVLTLINAAVVPVLLVCAGQLIDDHRARMAESAHTG